MTVSISRLAALLAPLAVLASCATAPAIRLAQPTEPVPALLAPIDWATSCAQLRMSLSGAAVVDRKDGRGCSARVVRLPLGDAELALDFKAGPARFSAATLTHVDDPACTREKPRPADCGREPSSELTVALELLRRAVEQRYGPPLATLAEAGNQSAEWRQKDFVLTAGLFTPAGATGWHISLRVEPNAFDAKGRQLEPGELLRR
jgi:hypothetical protein